MDTFDADLDIWPCVRNVICYASYCSLMLFNVQTNYWLQYCDLQSFSLSCVPDKDAVDMKRIFDAADMLQGKHNFSAFTSNRALLRDSDRDPNKHLTVHVSRGSSFFEEYSPLQQQHFDHWDFFFISRSFL